MKLHIYENIYGSINNILKVVKIVTLLDVYCYHLCRAQVVGWPPVRNYRKSVMTHQKCSEVEEASSDRGGGTVAFVKVSMDGAPYLRKVDLKMYTSYKELSDALAKMFSSFTMGTHLHPQSFRFFLCFCVYGQLYFLSKITH